MSRFNLPLSIPRKDLTGEFLLDWDPNDTSWNWNNWTATDVTWVAADKWYVKECGNFNGSSSDINWPQVFDWVWDFSFVSWFRTSHTWDHQNIFAERKDSDWNQPNMLCFTRINSNNKFNFEIRNDSWDDYSLASDTEYTDWKWHLWVGYRKWSDIYINIDNWAEIKSMSATSDDVCDDNNLFDIWASRDEEVFDWDIWLVRVYNRVLTPQEIKNLYLEWLRKLWPWLLQQYPEVFKGCVWYWDFKNWELSNLTDWSLLTPNWDVAVTTDHLWIPDWAYSFDWDWDYFSKAHDDKYNWKTWLTISTFIYFKWLDWSDNDLAILDSRTSSENKWDYGFYLDNDKITIRIYKWENSDSEITSDTVLDNDKWYLLNAVYDDWSWDIKSYINGSLDKSWSWDSWLVSWSENTEPLSIWKCWQDWDFKDFNWYMSYIIIHNRPLSDDEISKLYTLTKKKYIYPNPKYTPYSLPNPTLFINWNRDWDKFFDISWNWNDWTQSGWVTDWRIGQIKWIWFDAANSQYIDTNYKYNVNEITFTWWINTTQVSDNKTWIISNYKKTDWHHIWMRLNKDSDGWQLTTYADDNTDNADWGVLSTSRINDWKWHFICYSFKANDTMKVYVDWVLENNHSTNVWNIDCDDNWLIWKDWEFDYYIDWDILNTRIFNQTLTPKQIEELYYAEKWNFIN